MARILSVKGIQIKTMNKNISNENWTSIISVHRSWFELNLRELFQYRDLILLFVRRDFVARYKQTVLGPLWFVIQPLLTTLMFTVVFGKIAGIPTDGVPNILFYMSGIVAWNYFSSVVTDTSGTFVNNASIFGKVYFPRLALPISISISNLITFLVQLLLLGGFVVYFLLSGADIEITSRLLILPALVILLALMGLGFGILISSFTSKYRDLIHLVKFGIQLWMYISPIIYPLSAIPEKYKLLVLINPVAPIIESFRNAILGTGYIPVNYLLYSIVFTVILLGSGMVVFSRTEKNFMDTV